MPNIYQKGAAIVTRQVLRAVVRRSAFVPPPFPDFTPPASPGETQPSPAYVPHQRPPSTSPSAPPPTPPPPSALDRPTTAETVEELRRRLGKELYRVELDLQGGGRLGPRQLPCDCLSKKHNLGIEATAEELMSYEANPVYGQIITWLDKHAAEFEPAEIAQHPPSHYQALTPEVREFRKAVMGTEKLVALLSPQEQKEVLERAHKEQEDLNASQGGASREL